MDSYFIVNVSSTLSSFIHLFMFLSSFIPASLQQSAPPGTWGALVPLSMAAEAPLSCPLGSMCGGLLLFTQRVGISESQGFHIFTLQDVARFLLGGFANRSSHPQG